MNILINKSATILVRQGFSFILALTLSSCALTGDQNKRINPDKPTMQLSSSYLNGKREANGSGTPANAAQLGVETRNNKGQMLKSLSYGNATAPESTQLADTFSDQPSLTLSVEQMPMRDFLHYTFGGLLNINYILDEELKEDKQPVTLNIHEQISPRRLVQLAGELLSERDIEIKYDDGIYFIHRQKDKKQGQVAVGIGRTPDSVPNTVREILQVVPLKYGIKISVERTLNQLTGVKTTPDYDQSTLFLRGRRADILRSLDFINMLDAPANRGRYIGLIPLTYIDSSTFTEKVSLFLENEGIPVAVDKPNRTNLVMVPIEQIDSIVVFAADKELLDRVRYWANIIDKPEKGLGKAYFIYHPQFARASDLGESVSALLSGSTLTSTTKSANTSKTADDNDKTGAAPSAERIMGVSSDGITLVVDDKANAIIFYTSGSQYQSLLPLIQKLDVLPRQVMLDITIAEVQLKDEFSYGFEWAVTKGALNDNLSNGSAFYSNVGDAVGGIFNVQGADGYLDFSLSQSDSLVNVISKPTLLVRDGVTASIAVDDQTSITGSTIVDSNGTQTTSVEYLTTGLSVNITPSINAQGIIIMEINQSISSSTPVSDSNPDVADRSIDTEVVAQDGQTVMLAGLIADSKSSSEGKIPWLADIPFLGYLFKNGDHSRTRTELVMLITPRVIERTEQWDELTTSFQDNLHYLKFADKPEAQ